MRVLIQVSLTYQMLCPSDILLGVEVIPMPDQVLYSDQLNVDGADWMRSVGGSDGLGQRTWIHAANLVTVHYNADVEIVRHSLPLGGLEVSAHRDLPPYIIPYLFPSRYCESDQFASFVNETFDQTGSGRQIIQMADWIFENIVYESGSSDVSTTAKDVLKSRRGVCRDYAHLLIACARAAGIPARMASVYAPEVHPPDFHAVAEVWLNGGWHLIDPSRLASVNHMARIAVGRDATDISFMTIFGAAEMLEQVVGVRIH